VPTTTPTTAAVPTSTTPAVPTTAAAMPVGMSVGSHGNGKRDEAGQSNNRYMTEKA
jgi:hypothetical protein